MKEDIKKILIEQIELLHEYSKKFPAQSAELSFALAELVPFLLVEDFEI